VLGTRKGRCTTGRRGSPREKTPFAWGQMEFESGLGTTVRSRISVLGRPWGREVADAWETFDGERIRGERAVVSMVTEKLFADQEDGAELSFERYREVTPADESLRCTMTIIGKSST